jgi:hypothetical protein
MLPLDLSKYWCRAFYVVVAGAHALLGLAVALLGAPVVAMVCAVLACTAAVLAVRAHRGVIGPAVFAACVRATSFVARIVRGFAQVACFFIVTAAGIAGSELEVDRPQQASMWRRKRPLTRDEYRATFTGRGPERSKGWAGAYLSWARRSRNGWALALLPFLAVQRSAQPPDDAEVRGEIYTLY